MKHRAASLRLQSLLLQLTPDCQKVLKQELSYRKQIARQLRTQYVDGIHRPKYITP